MSKNASEQMVVTYEFEKQHRVQLFLKRITDIVGGIVGLAILSPLLIIIGILIKLTSKGPIFFLQERLGKGGKIFKIIKFRTMVVGAEHIGDGKTIRNEQDPRITKIGKILRKLSLDEFPQLINVLKGDMSLVGPRPPLTYHPNVYEEYTVFQKKRFSMRPGITGYAQVIVRNSVGWDERIALDLHYVEQFSILLDCKILLKTIKRVLTKDSLYLQ